MSEYDRRTVLKQCTGAALLAGGLYTTTTALGDDAEQNSQTPSQTANADGFDPDTLEHVWRYDDSITPLSVVDDTVYTGFGSEVPGGYDPEGMAAIDGEDGSILWEQEDVYGEGKPIVIEDALYVTDSDTLYAIDRTDGSQRWQCEFDAEQLGLSEQTGPDGAIFVSTQETLYAVETDGGSVRWEEDIGPKDGSSAPTPVVGHGAVFVIASGVLSAFEAEGGSTRWQHEMDGMSDFSGAPVVANGHVYASAWSVYAFDPETGEEQWEIFHDMETSIEVSSTALAKKDGGTNITLYDIETQEKITSVPDDSPYDIPFVLGDEIAITADEETGERIGIDLEGGDELWRAPSSYRSPTIHGNTVYFHNVEHFTPGDSSYTVVAVDKYDGEEQWEVESESPYDGAELIVTDEMILVEDGVIDALREVSDECNCTDDGGSDDGSDSDGSDGSSGDSGSDSDGSGDDSGSDSDGSDGDSADRSGNDSDNTGNTGGGNDGSGGDDGGSGSDGNETGNESVTDDDSDEAPGFGVVSSIVATAGGAVLAARRLVSSDDLTDDG